MHAKIQSIFFFLWLFYGSGELCVHKATHNSHIHWNQLIYEILSLMYPFQNKIDQLNERNQPLALPFDDFNPSGPNFIFFTHPPGEVNHLPHEKI